MKIRLFNRTLTIELGKTLDLQIMELVINKQKIKAIRLYKDETGKNLRESKDYVDNLEKKVNK